MYNTIEVLYTPNLEIVEKYEFVVFDGFKIVLNGFTKYDAKENITNKKKWKAIEHWNPYNRNCNTTEPVLTDLIKKMAQERLNEIITISGWNEYQENRFGK